MQLELDVEEIPAHLLGYFEPVRRPQLRAKNLAAIPWRVALALQADGWYLRSAITWVKKSPMPESVRDRPTKSSEQIFMLAKSARYFADMVAVQEESADPAGSAKRYASPFFVGAKHESGGYSATGDKHTAGMKEWSGTRNLRDVWTLSPSSFPGSHFAVFPPELPARCIAMGTSARGCCPTCGKPWVRVVAKEYHRGRKSGPGNRAALGDVSETSIFRTDMQPSTTTLGWRPACDCPGPDGDHPGSDCADYDEWPTIPCTVLDPFMGSGTTLLAAVGAGRHAIGIDLNREYVEMARRRLGLFAIEEEAADASTR